MPGDQKKLHTLDDNILAASEGDQTGLQKFFEGLLSESLFVPERFQEKPLSHSPKYPNDFVNILGVQDNERVLVPVFTQPEMITEWCGQAMLYKELKGDKLLQLIPADWWICVNPGQEVEKDVSPWEIDHLKGGPAFIAEIINELKNSEPEKTLQLLEINAQEYQELQSQLIEQAAVFEEITAMYLLKEKNDVSLEEALDTILVGLELNVKDSKQIEKIKQAIQSTTNRYLMGAALSRIVVGAQGSTLSLGVFQVFKPIYQKKISNFTLPALFKRLMKCAGLSKS